MWDKEVKYDVISSFTTEKYRFLSNFYKSPMDIDGQHYSTVEHFYQAEKTLDMGYKNKIIFADTPEETKKLGKQCPLRQDWDLVKDDIMFRGVLEKFIQNEDLRKMLLDTGNALLVEGNWWGDAYWGFDIKKGKGHNNLGNIIMHIRNGFRNV